MTDDVDNNDRAPAAIGRLTAGALLGVGGICMIGASFNDLFDGLVKEFGLGCCFTAPFLGGSAYLLRQGITDARIWLRGGEARS
jgi:hypothetical protein